MQAPRITRLVLALAAVVSLAAPSASAEALDWPALEREAVKLLSDYLQVDTVNPPGNETRGAEFLEAIFAAEGIETRRVESAPGRGNLVARLRGDGSKPAVVLMHHIDVVPADERYWTTAPLGGELKDGYVWGRGALDTKGLGVTHAMALLALSRSGAALGGDVVFLAVADEEAGGRMGAGYMVEQHFELFQGAGVVLNEGAAISVDDGGKVLFYGVEAAQKVPLWLRLTATGTPGHGSMPRKDAAANRLVRALDRVLAWETALRVVPEVQSFHAETADLAEPQQREAFRDLRAALSDPGFATAYTSGLRENAMVRNTISLTALSGSNKTNVISPEASAELDVRLLPDQDPEAFIAELRRVIADPAIGIETLLSFPPATSPTDHELFDVLRELAARHDPGAVVTTPLTVGFTDCHYFRERGIPCYGFAPFRVGRDDLTRFHGNDERLSVANVHFGTRFTYELVARLAGAAAP